MTKRGVFIALAIFWVFAALQNFAYIEGFDDGSVAAQCLDLSAYVGPTDALTHEACIDSAKAQRTLHFKLLGHRVFFQ